MAQPWKDSFDATIVAWIADRLAEQLPGLDIAAFARDCLSGFAQLELMARAQRIAEVMAERLPADPRRSIPLVAAAMGPVDHGATGITGFRLMPHGMVIATHGQSVFEESMAAQYELTRRFTAEFSIRAFLEQQPEPTLARLRQWTQDPDERVRRLPSEGTRPRLPWAPRLAAFVADPGPVLEILELLRDDPSATVRRSVANNLNDIGKDHPDVLLAVARRWSVDAGPQRQQLVRHALRSLIRAGDPRALDVLGIGGADQLEVVATSIEPLTVAIGGRVRIEVTVHDVRRAGEERQVAVDLAVHFVKASGRSAAKVFKGAVVRLAPGGTSTVGVTVSLAVHSTRTPYPGWHAVSAQLNGLQVEVGGFEVLPAPRPSVSG